MSEEKNDEKRVGVWTPEDSHWGLYHIRKKMEAIKALTNEVEDMLLAYEQKQKPQNREDKVKSKLVGVLEKWVLKTKQYTLGPGSRTFNPELKKYQILGDPDLYFPLWNGHNGPETIEAFSSVFCSFGTEEKLRFASCISKELRQYGINVKPFEVEQVIINYGIGGKNGSSE